MFQTTTFHRFSKSHCLDQLKATRSHWTTCLKPKCHQNVGAWKPTAVDLMVQLYVEPLAEYAGAPICRSNPNWLKATVML